MPAEPIKSAQFSGHWGFVVVKESPTGDSQLLEPGDVVRRIVGVDRDVRGKADHRHDKLGPNVDWNDPAFVAARKDFFVQNEAIDQAMADGRRLQQQINSSGLQKPPETKLTDVIRQVQNRIGTEDNPSEISPRLRSNGYLTLAQVNGLIADQYRDAQKAKIGPGVTAFKMVRQATIEDDSNIDAWVSLSAALLGIVYGVRDVPMGRALIGLAGIKVTKELQRLALGLAAQPNSAAAQIMLVAILTDWPGGTPRDLRQMKVQAEQKVPRLEKSDPSGARDARDALRQVGFNLANLNS